MITLRGLTWEHERGLGSVTSAAHEWTRHRRDIDILWSSRSLADFGDAPLATLAADVDLLVIDHPHVAAVADRDVLVPLDGTGHDDELQALSRSSVGPSFDSYRHGDRVLALPIDAAAQVSATRVGAPHDIPSTWPQVMELAREGRVLWPGKPIDAYSSLLTVAAGHGSAPFEQPGLFLPADDLDAALCLLRELAALVPGRCLLMSPIDVAEELSDAASNATYSPLLFGYTNYSRSGYRHHRLRYGDIPDGERGGSLLGGAGIAVSSASRHRPEAVAHAFWLASSAVQSGSFFDGGGQPAHADAWDDQRLGERTLDFFRGTRRTLERAYVRPADPRYLTFQLTVAPLVTQHLRGEISARRLGLEVERAAAGVGEVVRAGR